MEGTCGCCGLQLATGDMFCGSCGQPVPGVGMAAAPVSADWQSYPGYSSASASPHSRMWQPAPSAQYLGRRLAYDQEPEAPFDPLASFRLLGQFARQAAQYAMVFLLGGFAAAVLLVCLHLLGLSVPASAIIWATAAVLAALLLGCLYCLLPVPALLSEWKFSVDDQAAAAEGTFEHLAWAVRRHEIPLDELQVRRLKLADGESRDYLELRRDLFTGFISCFAYGQDLYLGWTFWLRISPLRYLLMRLARWWQTLTRRGTDMYVTFRFDYAWAMREAMHSVAREGIKVALGQAEPLGQGTVGTAVPVAESQIERSGRGMGT